MSQNKPYLFISPDSYPGTTAGMKQYEVTGLVEQGDELSMETVRGRKAVVLGAWHPVYYRAIKKLRREDVEIWLFWTSSVAQCDFSNGGIEVSFLRIIKDLVDSNMIDRLVCGNNQVELMLKNMVPPEKVILLPYCFNWREIRKYYDRNVTPNSRWVDLFCPADARKNMLPQILASKLANAKLHLSGTPDKYLNFVETINYSCSPLGWMPKDIYFKNVQLMELGLQVTFAESFDYVVAEHFALERPCLFSPPIGQWIDEPYLREMLLVPDVDNPSLIADYMTRIFNLNESDKKDLNKTCSEFMYEEAEKRMKNAKAILKSMLEDME